MTKFINSYSTLPQHFYSSATAQKFENCEIIKLNEELLHELQLPKEDILSYLSGQKTIEGSLNIATAYSGHQFGHFNPTLGDGRALLIGEVESLTGQTYDIQLKGSGRTAYSRGGDGLSPLGPVLREYVLSEFMNKVNIPATKALCAVHTNETVYRQTEEPGGIFTRVAKSHIRVGTFEFFAARDDHDSLRKLTDYTINRHYPQSKGNYISFVKEVALNQAKLIAKWMSLGFIHGVMNTDNTSICGETIDFGPCAFIDHYQSSKVFSSIDVQGRYAFNNQIHIAKWNLFKLASTLVPIIGDDIQNSIKKLEIEFENIDNWFDDAYQAEMNKKFGLDSVNEQSKNFIKNFLIFMENNQLDFTNTFINLLENTNEFVNRDGFDELHATWEKLRTDNYKEIMAKANPRYIPRNHLVQRMIDGAYAKDYTLFNELLDCLNDPYRKDDRYEKFTTPPKEEEVVQNTFCGT